VRISGQTQQKQHVAIHFMIRHALRMSVSAPDAEIAEVARKIQNIRGQRTLLDSDLAAMYGVPTHRLNEAVKRNLSRFPPDFAFVLTKQEVAALISQIAISKPGRGGRRKPPRAFNEHGAIMAATILNSPRAEQMSVHVVRAFVRLRAMLASNAALARKLEVLEKSVAALDIDTRHRFDQVYEAILGLMGPATKRQ
jgi:hypothetical protein